MAEEPRHQQSFVPLPENPKVAAIVDRLVAAIAAGDFLPGSRLPSERSLATSLAVGRNTVRAALSELSARGLIETRRGRTGGAFVLHADQVAGHEALVRVFGGNPSELEATLDAIALGYSLVGEAAALRRTDEDLAAISVAVEDFRTAFAANDSPAVQIADGRFHYAIIESTGQPMLHEIIRDLDRKISLGAPLHILGRSEQHKPMQARALRDHYAILAAIRDRDRQAAFDISYEHAKIDLDIILELIQDS